MTQPPAMAPGLQPEATARLPSQPCLRLPPSSLRIATGSLQYLAGPAPGPAPTAAHG